MPRSPQELTPAEIEFLTRRHLGTLTTIRRDGSPHVVAIAFTFDPAESTVSIICSDATQKIANVESNGRGAVCQVEGIRWLSLEGTATVTRDPTRIAVAVDAFERRYRPTSPNPDRVAIEILVDRVLGKAV